MNVYVFAGDKGGIGKSTASILWTQYLLAIQKQKGAFIDLDPQCNSSEHFIKMVKDEFHEDGKKPSIHPEYNAALSNQWHAPIKGISSIADIFHGTQAVYPYPTWLENLDIFPSYSSRLQEAEEQKKQDAIKNVRDRFVLFIENLAKSKEYDFIVIDTRPAKGPLTMAAMAAATHVFFPTVMEQWSINGVWRMFQLFKQEAYRRPENNPIRLAGILPNKVEENTKLHSGFLKDLKEMEALKDYVLPVIKKRIVYSEIVVDGAQPRSVYELPAEHPARIESIVWGDEAYRRIKNG